MFSQIKGRKKGFPVLSGIISCDIWFFAFASCHSRLILFSEDVRWLERWFTIGAGLSQHSGSEHVESSSNRKFNIQACRRFKEMTPPYLPTSSWWKTTLALILRARTSIFNLFTISSNVNKFKSITYTWLICIFTALTRYMPKIKVRKEKNLLASEGSEEEEEPQADVIVPYCDFQCV